MITGYDWAGVDGNVLHWDAIGGSFVIVRAAYTYNGLHEDNTCRLVRLQAAKHGKVFGAYMILGFRQDDATPEQQADNFIRVYGVRRPGELPPSLDLEADSAAKLGLTVAQCLAWAERAYARLKKAYGTVMIYTSRRVWGDVFGDLSSDMGEAPLWVKVPYPYKVHNPPHPEACPADGSYELPKPWANPASPGAWIVQYQGDALGVSGFSSTVDCNKFIARTMPDTMWLASKLYVGGNAASVAEWQKYENLASADGVIGPATFAALTM